MEKILETKSCKSCKQLFSITQEDQDFYDKISPTFAERKFQIPRPQCCPKCRQQRRLAFRNEIKFYRRNCDASGKSIISMYSPDKPFKIYEPKLRWSDQWNPLDYGRAFDFKRPFFEQFAELMKQVPRISLYQNNVENAEYTNHTDGARNSYLSVDVANSESVFYSHRVLSSENIVDSYRMYNSQHCYESMFMNNCFNCSYSNYCFDSSDLYFCVDCVNCHYCINCQGVEGKSYYVDNESVGREKFLELLQRGLSGYKRPSLGKNFIVQHSENVLESKNVAHSKNIFFSRDINDAQDLKYCYECWSLNDSYDTYETFGGSKNYELHGSNRTNNSAFSHMSYECSFSWYIDSCHSSSNLFGCVGLRNKEYCIFNTQYTKAEYERLVPQIIEKMKADGEWGEFFPTLLSPFGYNETIAQDHFPLTEEEALKKGMNWSTFEAPSPQVERTVDASTLPQSIEEVSDEVLNVVILCEMTGKPFRIIKSELNFYRKHHLPLPRRHPDQRHQERMNIRKEV